MKKSLAVFRSNFASTSSAGTMFKNVLLLAVVSTAMAQNPRPGGGGPGVGGQQGPPASPPTAGAHLDIMDGSSASYTVTEQFVGINFPNDATGISSGVAGTLIIAADGSIAPGSKLTIDLSKLKSDQEQRDNYVRTRTLETDKFPMAEFVPTKIQGLATMIPTQGQTGFELTGNLTIHGVTKEVTFQGIATFGRDSTIAGRAKTSFTFATFGLTKPMIGRLMSVDDKIGLDLVFKFKRT